MLLIITSKQDKTADWFEEQYLKTSRVAWHRFNTEDFPESVNITLSTSEVNLSVNDIEILPKDIHSIWYRRPQPSILRQHTVADEILTYIRGEVEEFLRLFYGQFGHCLWLNHPEMNKKCSDKLKQLQVAVKTGLTVPNTLITNDYQRIIAFARRYGQLLIKPIKIGTIDFGETTKIFFSNRLSLEKIQSFEKNLVVSPLIYQEYVTKLFELRIVVIKDACFAIKIDSQNKTSTKVDWRRNPYAVKWSIYQLPEEIALKCIKLVKAEGLLFSTFDFIVTPEGDHVFLEHNPNGQFAWLEEMTGIPIGKKLLKTLS